GAPILGANPELVLHGPGGKALPCAVKTEFSPLAIGIGGTLQDIPIVFAGYGITAEDGSGKLHYDDYAGIDVKGKAVLIIRREPQQGNRASPLEAKRTTGRDGQRTTPWATFQHKVTNAFQHGAAVVLLVNDLHGLKGAKDELLRFTAAGADPASKIPVVMLGRKTADQLLAGAGQPALAELEKQIDQDLKPCSRPLKEWTATARITIDRSAITTRNVIGVLEGTGEHAEETVVLGAHYDHLGRGGMFSGSLAFLSHDIHNGADDNASGTAMVLEMARRLGARRDAPPRRIVFIAFSGEERGLLGSHYYVEHPLFPLKSTVMMFNCDMVGRLNRKNELTMIGTGTSPGLDSLVDVLGKSAGLTIKKVAGMTDGFGGSDHQSFYPKGIPVLFAFTGVHGDYHRPTDDSDRINYAGMARVADYLELLLLEVIRRPERPAFVRLAEPRRTTRMGFSVYLGTQPDYSSSSQDGLKLEAVSAGSPAEKAGLKGGDIITGFDGKPISTINDYMESLRRHKPGDTVEILVKRDGKEVKLKATLGSRSHE
ncbi:MAG TPA: M20/M25/M40 family metallo-hydrolase, partial [Isosphaeraceae bacterium]|nr:M20/M25/M40 family metallo-hydrolase [Isosphaeraceae bacterium]